MVTDGPIVQLGARTYERATGRFLTVDSIEGGCANAYVYVTGDPVNEADLSGKGCPPGVKGLAETLGWRSVIEAGAKLLHGRERGKGNPDYDDAVKSGATSLWAKVLAGFKAVPKKEEASLFKRGLGFLGKIGGKLASNWTGALFTALDYACDFTDLGKRDTPVVG